MSAPRYFSSPEEDPSPQGAKTLRCELCPRRCRIPPGKSGACSVRFNRAGRAEIPYYGYITAMAEDPIEKKPLYHFRPGSSILSLGFAGCNLRCPFCQNWHISQGTDAPGRRFSPEELLRLLGSSGAREIAYTYSEPLVHMEYLLDCMKLTREAGIANVLVSNGCISPRAAADILPLVDAANIDLKSFSRETYARVLGGDLDAVLDFIKAAAADIHLELTTLVVPGLNDGAEEIEKCAAFIAGLPGDGVPWHLSAYHPDYRWNAPPTEPALLERIGRRARELLPYVYTGNVPGLSNDTPCPRCGKALVVRRGYRVDAGGLVLKSEEPRPRYYCARCGAPAPVRY